MTRGQIEKLLRRWQIKLGLSGWNIKIDFNKPASGDDDITVWRSTSYDEADICLEPGWDKWEKDQGIGFTELNIVHELVHIVLRDLEIAHMDLIDELSSQAQHLANDRFKHELEGVVDRIARILIRE